VVTVQYKEYNDYELIYMVKENDETAYNLLYNKYKPLVISLAKKYADIYFNFGIDINDFIIAGYIGLDNSIKKFRDYDKYQFKCLLYTCINRQMQSLVKQEKIKKNQILNNSLYYEALQTNSELDFLEIKEDEKGVNPEKILIEQENLKNIYDKYITKLKGLELEVFKLKARGYTNVEISKILNTTVKAINNAITRIKKKYNIYQNWLTFIDSCVNL